MVLVAYRHGLRAAELVTLRWDAIDFAHAFRDMKSPLVIRPIFHQKEHRSDARG
jgi:hypothetical protein